MERFLELYGEVYKNMYRLAFYYLGNPQDAEDAVSETVLKAYEKFDTLRKEEAFRAWIFAILVNQCKSQWKRRTAKETVELHEEPSYHPSLDDRILTDDILSCLSEEERRIVVLAVFGGYKGEEIAKMQRCKHSTIRSRYRRALKKLERQLLSEEVQR